MITVPARSKCNRQWAQLDPEEGTPQGGVISPIISNVFLHEVLDKWFEQTIKPRLRGRAFLVRYADDFVMGFQRKDEAERVYQVLPLRFQKYGLSINLDKSRVVRFARPQGGENLQGEAEAATFDFLGFTHYWSRSRKGQWYVMRKTASSRQRRTLRGVTLWCRKNRHESIPEQHRQLCQKLQGHYAYYGIIGNSRSIVSVRHKVLLTWHKWLSRRSRGQAQMKWARFISMLNGNLNLPPARIVHSDRVAKPQIRGTGCPKGRSTRNYSGIALGRSSLSAASMRNTSIRSAINDLDPTDLGPTLKHVSNVT